MNEATDNAEFLRRFEADGFVAFRHKKEDTMNNLNLSQLHWFDVVVVPLFILLVFGSARADEAVAVNNLNKASEDAERPLKFEIQLETVLQHLDGEFLWFHPRVTAIPGLGKDQGAAVIMTLQKHLRVSDHYSGLHIMRTDDLGRTWSKPDLKPQLDWVREGNVDIAVADVTPGWHPRQRKLIAVGAQVRYSQEGEELDDVPRAHQTAYAVFDPKTGRWAKWRRLEMPTDKQFNFARNACAQWLVEPDGSVLLPFYHSNGTHVPRSVTVVRCSFDGDQLKYQHHGNVLPLKTGRGFAEPSLTKFQGRYFLTIRSNSKAWVTISDDGRNFQSAQPWTFDDGEELGSYNTQQHWLTHSDGLFLCYTRRGANNDHISRHRAPLFIAQVDPHKLQVIRSTERVLVPERGATLGNFGAAAVNQNESWVTVAEFVGGDAAHKRGADGSLFLARVIWSKPNRSVSDSGRPHRSPHTRIYPRQERPRR